MPLHVPSVVRSIVYGLVIALLPAAATAQTGSAPSTHALGDWPETAHGYDGNRYVQTDRITRANVGRLRVAWTFELPKDDAMMEASPVVVDGTMYITSGRDDVYAIDAKSGTLKWSYRYPHGTPIALIANRGVAVIGGRVFFGTLDGHVVALDAATGALLWNVVGVRDPENSFYTMAPLAYNGLVMIGVSNGDWGGAGYVTAFDAASGKRVWDWQTIPSAHQPGSETWAHDSWKRGGGAVWGGLTLDPDAGVLYIDVGNPEPDLIGTGRAGDNLYTDSMVALDISGRRPAMKWYRQFTPHDTHDWDPAMPPVRFTGVVQGVARDLVAAGDKGGNFWVLDARSGQVLERLSVTTQTQPTSEPSLQGSIACPGTNGGVQYNGGAYLPETNAFYVPSVDQCQVFKSDGTVTYVAGQLYLGGTADAAGASTGWFHAIDVGTGSILWERKEPLPAIGGALALSSGLVFTGELNGDLEAYDARSGALVWHAPTGSPIKAAPAAYGIDGTPYIAIASGPVGINFSLPGVSRGSGSRVTAFTLR